RRILSAPRPRAGRTPANESPITITSPGVRKIYRFRAPRVKAVTLPTRGVNDMNYSAPAAHRSALPTRAQDRRKVVPHATNRIGALVATAGLALALISLYLPWLHADSGSFTALDITSVIDVRSVAPVLFLGLVVMMLLVAVSLVTRLGAARSEEHTSELQSRFDLVCRLLLEKKNTLTDQSPYT